MFRWGKRDLPGNSDIVFFPIGNMGKGGQIAVMIQKQMQFHGTLGAAKSGPGKQGQTQRDGGTVQRQELVSETEAMFPQPCHLADIKRLVKQVAVQLPGAMGIGIGQGGFVGSLLDTQVTEFAQAAGQSAADFA